jgi:hypothetical protein
MAKYTNSDAQLLLQIPQVWQDYASGDPDAILNHRINTIAATNVAKREAAAAIAAAKKATAEQAAIAPVPVARQALNPRRRSRPAPVISLVMYLIIVDH